MSSRASPEPAESPETQNLKTEIITESMLKEEQKHLTAQQLSRAKRAKLVKQDLEEEEKQQMLKRLNFLVDKAGVYSNWLANKLQARQTQLAMESNNVKPPELAANSTEMQGKHEKKTVETESVADGNTASKERAAMGAPRRQPSLVTGGVMREYQLVGLEWLVSLYDNGLNGILADEMGLGKTLQTIAFLAYLREMGTYGPFLIVGPLSTISNWVEEIAKFTPTIPVVLYHGTPTERAKLRKNKLKMTGPKMPIVVTSYEICMNDRKHLQVLCLISG
jgi:ATP-dependent DNA helicase